MRWRFLALLSLGANFVLAAVILLTAERLESQTRSRKKSEVSQSAGSLSRTNIVVRRQFFSWQDLEASDYSTYVTNLRDIGCPEQTIRDIIIADVNATFAKRLATEVVTPSQQWWLVEPDTNVLQIAVEKARNLDEERRLLLTRLLGPSWESGDLINLPRPSRQNVVLDGPVLGNLPGDVKQAVQEASLRSEERLQAYLDRTQAQGIQPDPVEIAKLRQQTRDELARSLSPQQLEEFLLRYSQHAEGLRSQLATLKFFNASQDEFRSLFRATDALEQRLALLPANEDPNTESARRSLLEQREQAIRIALGPRRYQEYRLLQDPMYRDAVATANASGNPESARLIYQVSLAAADEALRIQSNATLTADQKMIEMRQLDLDQLKASTIASGGDLPPEPQQVPPRRTYTIRPGDTAAVVSLIYGVPVSALSAANPNMDLNRLRPGQLIMIPRNALTPRPAAP